MNGRTGVLRPHVLALIVLLGLGCRAKPAAPPMPTQPAHALETFGMAEAEPIRALGILRPAQTLQLSSPTGGTVRSVAVEVGTLVRAGQVLAELDTTAQEFELQRARESVILQQALLEDMLRGPDAALVERSEAEHAQQVGEADIALQMARWKLEQASLEERSGQRTHALEIALAQSTAEQQELRLAQAQAQSPAAEITAAQIGLARAQDALQSARIEYQKALDRPWEPQEVRDAYAKAVWLAEQEVELARARLDGGLDAQYAHELGLELMAAQRQAATLQLSQTLEARVPHTVTFALLEAQVDLAQLQLEGLRAWQNPFLDPPAAGEIVQTRALLRQAELAVQELEWQLEGAQLHAPFDGVVSAVNLDPGEWATPGAPVVELLDTTGWRVETRNVGELKIGRVQVGQDATVWMNAFANEPLHGRVLTVSPVAVVQQGDTTYTLIIELEPTDLDLRPGMTAQVEILTR